MFCSSEQDVQCVFDFFETVRKATGSELNRSKTMILELTRNGRMRSEYLVDQVKICGVWHHRDYEKSREMNSEECIKKIASNIERMMKMPCTIRGNVLYVNTVICPKTYFTYYKDIPAHKAVYKESNKDIVYSLLYGEGKREIFNRKTSRE